MNTTAPDYSNMRVLFTVPPTHPAVADYGAILTSHVHRKRVNKFLSASYPIPSWGLHWLKENCPTIEVMDMPKWPELERELQKGIDILGISFYTYQVPDVIRLVELARKYDVKEIWGGNYGTQTPGIEFYFDRIIKGNGEAETYRLLYKKEIQKIKHPIVVQTWSLNGIIGNLFRLKRFSWSKSGIIWTIKGCYFKCKFCVSPSFIDDTRNKISLEELERVLDKYVEMNIKTVSIMDLDFLMDKNFADQVIELLHERKLRWTCMTRMDHIQGRIKYLREKGCEIIFVGVESMNVANLADHDKYNINQRESIQDLFDEFKHNKMGYYLFYMLGFEKDTVKSLKKEISYLASLQATFYQFQVVTPLPGSQMFEDYKNKIINWNWEDWNCNTLVWKHPYITPKEMLEILIYAKKKSALSKILFGMVKRGTMDDSFDGNELITRFLKISYRFYSLFKRKPVLLSESLSIAHDEKIKT